MSTPNQQDNTHKYAENKIKQYWKWGRNEIHSDLTWKAPPLILCMKLLHVEDLRVKSVSSPL